MSWHFVERWLQKVNQHSTLLGKFWITFLVVFRIVVVSSVGDRVYADEQSEFRCNTQEVGCPNVCFNKFSPISHIRFWSFQIILVATPSIAFIVYSAHQVKKKPLLPKQKPGASGQSGSPMKKMEAYKDGYTTVDGKRQNSKMVIGRTSTMNGNPQQEGDLQKDIIKELFGDDKSAFSQHYILYTLSVVIRTGVEVVFLYLQYDLFGFSIVELYKCEVSPCPNVVDCFVSRPMEKTIFLLFMFVITVLCLVLNAFELFYLFWKLGIARPKIKRRHKRLLYLSSVAKGKSPNIGGQEVFPQRPNFQLPTAPPVYGKVVNLPDLNKNSFHRSTLDELEEPMAMSFNINDAVLHEEVSHEGGKYLASLMNSPSMNNQFKANDAPTEQPYMTHAHSDPASRPRGCNNYV